MKIIIVVNATKPPLTGIGRYTWELASRIIRMPEIDEVRFLFEGRWVNDISALLNQSSANLAVRQRLLRNPFAVADYLWLSPLPLRHRLISFSNHVYHNPNFYLLPFASCFVFFLPIFTLHEGLRLPHCQSCLITGSCLGGSAHCRGRRRAGDD